MTTPYTYRAPVPARFYQMPDGSQSSVQMTVGPDGSPRPLEVKTQQQYSDWQQILAASPPTSVQRATALAVSMVRPVSAAASADDPSMPGWLPQRQAEAEAAAGTAPRPADPATQAEWDRRALAARDTAAALGCQLVYVPVTDALGNLPHLELRIAGSGIPMTLGSLPDIERALEDTRRHREHDAQQIAAWEQWRARMAREASEALAQQPAHKIAALEAERDADRGRIARLERALAGRGTAETGTG